MTTPPHHSASSVELKLLPVIRKSEVKSKGGNDADAGEVVVYSGKEQPRPRGEICVRWKGTETTIQCLLRMQCSEICNIRRNESLTKVSTLTDLISASA